MADLELNTCKTVFSILGFAHILAIFTIQKSKMPGTVSKHIEIKAANKNEAYLYTIRQLRARNFSKKLPFLIVSAKLPEGQVYRDFPDGRMELQQMAPGGPSFTFTVIKKLLPSEADKVRKEHGLF